MVFVTVGSAPQDFSRLVKKMDEIAPLLGEQVVIQLGFTRYKPKNCKWFDFVPYNQALEYFKSARIIIGHASAGPILHAREFHKPLIIVPRNGDLGEHIDSHQVETARALCGVTRFIEVLYDVENLLSSIRNVLNKNFGPEDYEKSESLDSLVRCVRGYLVHLEEK